MTTGKLITLEGGEGAGKSTVLDAVRRRLESRGIDVVVTREPGGTVLGEAVRAIVLDPARRDLCAESELLLMFAARAQLVRELIRPALEAGRWVLSDRFTDASFPWWDASVAMISIAAQILMSVRRIENWWLWIAANMLSTGLYAAKSLWITTGLYVILLAISTGGLIAWKRARA